MQTQWLHKLNLPFERMAIAIGRTREWCQRQSAHYEQSRKCTHRRLHLLIGLRCAGRRCRREALRIHRRACHGQHMESAHSQRRGRCANYVRTQRPRRRRLRGVHPLRWVHRASVDVSCNWVSLSCNCKSMASRANGLRRHTHGRDTRRCVCVVAIGSLRDLSSRSRAALCTSVHVKRR